MFLCLRVFVCLCVCHVYGYVYLCVCLCTCAHIQDSKARNRSDIRSHQHACAYACMFATAFLRVHDPCQQLVHAKFLIFFLQMMCACMPVPIPMPTPASAPKIIYVYVYLCTSPICMPVTNVSVCAQVEPQCMRIGGTILHGMTIVT